MNLSLKIISNYLKDLNPSGDWGHLPPEITGVRLFTKERDRQYVYVGQAGWFNGNSDDKRTAIVNRDDMLVFDTEDLALVFNRVLDCFSYYNNWEKKCMEAIYRKDSFSSMLGIGAEIFGNFILALDKNFFILASAKGFDPEKRENLDSKQKMNIDFWEGIIKTNVVPISIIQKIGTNRNPFHTHKINSIKLGTGIVPVMMTALSKDDTLSCYLLVSNIFGTPNEVSEELLTELVRILDLWSEYNFWTGKADDRFGLSEKMFGTCELSDTSILSNRLANMGWRLTDKKQFMQIVHVRNNTITLKQLGYTLNNIYGCYCGYDSNYLYLQININMIKEKDFYNNIANAIKKSSCRAGVSFFYTDLEEVFRQQRFAALALQYGDTEVGSISFIDDYMLHAFKETINKATRKTFYHPALQILEAYDKEHDMELSDTFLNYLLCGQNCTKTGQKMFLHRNTVEYRVNKALECMQVDLDNDRELAYLMISFLLRHEASFPKTESAKYIKRRDELALGKKKTKE